MDEAQQKEMEALRRQLAEATNALTQSNAERSRLADQARAAKAAAEAQMKDTWLRTLTAKHGAIKHEHVAKLLDADIVWRDGKPAINGKPDVDAEKYVSDWFAGEGQHYAKPIVTPGAGAAPTAGVAPQPAPMDLGRHGHGLNQDRTQFVRGLTHKAPTAPAAPAANGAAASKP